MSTQLNNVKSFWNQPPNYTNNFLTVPYNKLQSSNRHWKKSVLHSFPKVLQSYFLTVKGFYYTYSSCMRKDDRQQWFLVLFPLFFCSSHVSVQPCSLGMDSRRFLISNPTFTLFAAEERVPACGSLAPESPRLWASPRRTGVFSTRATTSISLYASRKHCLLLSFNHQ